MPRFWLGLVCLLLAVFSAFAVVGTGLVSLTRGAPVVAVIMPLAAGILFAAFGGGLWLAALKNAGGDDLFSGERGLLMSLMLISSVALLALLVFLVTNPEPLRGFMEGWAR
jgi:hypothetical protein